MEPTDYLKVELSDEFCNSKLKIKEEFCYPDEQSENFDFLGTVQKNVEVRDEWQERQIIEEKKEPAIKELFMEPKQRSSGMNCCKPKRRRRSLTLKLKQEIITKAEHGAGTTQLCEEYGIPKSTISTILKNKERIMAVRPTLGTTAIIKGREAITEMERILIVWMREVAQKGESLTRAVICEKAKQIYEHLKTTVEVSGAQFESFTATRGWFERFKKRVNMKYVAKYGEVVSVDAEEAETYKGEFEAFILQEGYTPQQVFNADETGLFWKKMPNRTYISHQEATMPGHKPMKDRLSLLVAANASGDLKIKPLLVYHCQTPRIFKQKKVNPATLGVLWMHNKKAWVSRILFNQWLTEVFGPTVKRYLEINKLPLKALLILDSAKAHDPELDCIIKGTLPFITIKYLPLNITPIIQPMDQQVKFILKKIYTKHMFAQCLEATSRTSLTEFWKQGYTILEAVKNIVRAWRDISTACLNSSWRNLWPSVVTELEVRDVQVEREIVQMSRRMNLEVSEEDIETLIKEHSQELTSEELHYVAQESDTGSDDGEENVEEESLDVAKAKKFVELWTDLRSFLYLHPNSEKTEQESRAFEDNVVTYFRTFLDSRKKQKISHSSNNDQERLTVLKAAARTPDELLDARREGESSSK